MHINYHSSDRHPERYIKLKHLTPTRLKCCIHTIFVFLFFSDNNKINS